jgi:segregation and condensation protein B
MSEERFLTLRFLEAMLFASAEPVAEKVLAQRLPEGTDIGGLLEELQGHYANRGVHLLKFEKSWAFRTAPDLSSRMTLERVVTRKLSRAAVETLAIIAYHQPVTRAEIEDIRGVVISRGTLDTLLEAGWIKPIGHRETPGRPATWGTTEAFLEHFGLESCAMLPGIEELRAAGLLDVRASVSTLGTQMAMGELDETDDEADSAEAALELRGEPEDSDETDEGPAGRSTKAAAPVYAAEALTQLGDPSGKAYDNESPEVFEEAEASPRLGDTEDDALHRAFDFPADK